MDDGDRFEAHDLLKVGKHEVLDIFLSVDGRVLGAALLFKGHDLFLATLEFPVWRVVPGHTYRFEYVGKLSVGLDPFTWRPYLHCLTFGFLSVQPVVVVSSVLECVCDKGLTHAMNFVDTPSHIPRGCMMASGNNRFAVVQQPFGRAVTVFARVGCSWDFHVLFQVNLQVRVSALAMNHLGHVCMFAAGCRSTKTKTHHRVMIARGKGRAVQDVHVSSSLQSSLNLWHDVTMVAWDGQAFVLCLGRERCLRWHEHVNALVDVPLPADPCFHHIDRRMVFAHGAGMVTVWGTIKVHFQPREQALWGTASPLRDAWMAAVVRAAPCA
jgi:hypothetical protein